MRWDRSISPNARSAPATVAEGAKSPPIASSAIRAKSGVLCGDSLLTRVIAALPADAVRAFHAAAPRAALDGDRRSDLMRVARALSALGGSALGNGHGTLVSKKVIRLTRRLVQRAEHVPAGVLRRSAAARPEIQISTTRRTQSFAIFAADNERWYDEQPLLPDGRSQVQTVFVRVDEIYVGLVGLFAVRLGEQHMHIVGDRYVDVDEATTAAVLRRPLNSTTEVISLRARSRQTASDLDSDNRTGIGLQPDRIVGGEHRVDARRMRVEEPEINWQHSPAI